MSRRVFSFTRVFFAFAVATLLVAAAAAQSLNTGTVFGVITDPSGAVIPNAAIELRDSATGTVRNTTSNEAGRYTFSAIDPASYTVKATATGFQSAESKITVTVGKSFGVNLVLPVGQASQTVEVVSNAAAAELQTMDSAVGETLSGNMLNNLPMQQRSVSSLLLYQPASMPQQAATQGSSLGGQVAGAQSDQNTIMLDGANITNAVSGNSDYYTNFRGGQEPPIPVPVESIEEFKVSTNNQNASFAGAAGSQVMLVTKRGTNSFHGGVYEYFQNSALNANTWDRNFRGQVRPVSHDNRYGATFGGFIPFLPQKAKTYFFANWEGRQLSQVTQIQKLVPSPTLRQGILRFRDSSGNIVSYNLSNSAACSGGKCDPLSLGINPIVQKIWNTMPQGNDTSNGNADGLNTLGFSGTASLPIKENFGVMRLDHTFSQKWQTMTTFRYFEQAAAVDKQIDIGGQLSGDTSGVPTSAANIPRQPRYLVSSLTGTLSPNITNVVNFSFFRDWWQWQTAGAPPQTSGTTAGLQIGGEAQNTALVPMNVDTNSVRTRMWDSHSYSWRDDLSWLKGNHLLQMGGSVMRTAVLFNRNDGQTRSLTQIVYQLTASTSGAAGGLNIPAAYRPPVCSATLATNCLPSAQSNNWNNLYASALGLVDSAAVLGTRSASLQPNPLGVPTNNDDRYDDYSLYVNDTWHIKPSLTLNYGLNWSYDTPPYDTTGKQSMMVYAADNTPLLPWQYLQRRAAAAAQGQIYNPVIGFMPIRGLHRKYPWATVFSDFAPKVAVAWNPRAEGDGFFSKLLGQNKTVIRGGYSQLYDRLNGVQKVINGLQGVGFQQTLSCVGPNTSGQCLGTGKTDPTSAFRIGVNGATVPVPPIQALSQVPLIPGTSAIASATQAFIPTTFQMDPQYQPGRNHEFDLTIQRELSPTTVLEVGYIGHIAHGIYSPLQMNQVPFFMPFGGQTFAAAFDAVATALRSGTAAKNVAAQPFFEAALAGSSFCKGQPSCTAGIASSFASNFTNSQVTNLWNNVQGSYVFGPPTAATNQVQSMFFWAGRGRATYNAGFVALRERNFHGLTMDANLTWAHSLDNTAGGIQDVDSAVINSYNLNYGYGTSAFDRKFVFNMLANYQLPFGKGSRFVDHFTRGWSVSPIWSWYSGLPLKVLVGSSQEFGQFSAASAGAILVGSNNFGNSAHSGVAGDTTTNVATSGNPAKGGTGLNLFANPVAVYQSFRPILLSQDTSAAVGGQLRGQARWNVDMSVAKQMKFTERVGSTFSVQMFNMFNHVQFADPSVNLQSPQTFGVIGTQLNSPRVIALGLHVDF